MKNQGMSSFQRTIKEYLDQVADMDAAFALTTTILIRT